MQYKLLNLLNAKATIWLSYKKWLSQCNKEIAIEWVPSHVGIPGNTLADSAAKEAIENDDILNIKLNYYDIKSLIKTLILQRWQSSWTATHCTLQRLRPVLKGYKWDFKKRREQVIISRIRTGACLLMVKHHFSADTPLDYCHTCRTKNNPYHLFFKCPQLTNHRVGILTYLDSKNLSYSMNSLLDENFPSTLIFKYLKDIGYYNKI